MKKLISLSVLSVVAVGVLATGSYMVAFNNYYKVKKGGTLDKAKCTICHVGHTKKLNAYGTDLGKAMAGAKKLSTDALKKVENLDSNKDGVKNGDAIKKDKLP